MSSMESGCLSGSRPNVDAFYRAVREDLEDILSSCRLSSDYLDALRAALSLDGKLFSPLPRTRWPLQALLPVWGAGGNWHLAIPIASAAELVGLFSDVLDEIEDEDSSPLVGTYGISRAINIAFGLLALAAQSLSRTPKDVSGPVWASILTAADGQHHDLGAPAAGSQAEYMSLVDRKAGALISAFTEAGARVARLDEERCLIYRDFGVEFGRWAQLANDLHDLWPRSTGKSDLARKLLTLPMLFILEGPKGDALDKLKSYLADQTPLSPDAEAEIRQLLFSTGALHYTWLKSEIYRNAAVDLLRTACPDRAGALQKVLLPESPTVEKLLATAVDAPTAVGGRP